MIKQRVQDSFLEYMRVDRSASELTISAYGRELRNFGAWLPDTLDLQDVDLNLLERYLQSRKGLKASSLARSATVLKRFFHFLALEEWIDGNSAAHLALPKGHRPLPKHLSVQEMERLLATAKVGLAYARDRETMNLRDRTMITLLYASGLRVSELTSLTLQSIDFRDGYIRITGKGDKERISPFAPVVAQLLKTHVQKQGKRLECESTYLFVNAAGTRLSRQSVFHVVRGLAAQAGITGDISPHTLRHSYATHLLQSGMGLRSLQTLLGHSDLSTTQIYAHVTPEHLRIALDKFHPRG